MRRPAAFASRFARRDAARTALNATRRAVVYSQLAIDGCHRSRLALAALRRSMHRRLAARTSQASGSSTPSPAAAASDSMRLMRLRRDQLHSSGALSQGSRRPKGSPYS